MFAVDWAVKKALRIYNIQKYKVKSIPPTLEAFAKFLKGIKKATNFYFEEGGGDSFKLQARRAGHQVFTIPGKQIKEYRDELGLVKSDIVDAVVIGKFAKLYLGKFYQFRELDDITAKISIIFKGRKDTEQTKVRQKNRLWALKKRLELVSLDGHKAKIIKRAEKVIKALESDFEGQTKQSLALQSYSIAAVGCWTSPHANHPFNFPGWIRTQRIAPPTLRNGSQHRSLTPLAESLH